MGSLSKYVCFEKGSILPFELKYSRKGTLGPDGQLDRYLTELIGPPV